MPSPAFVIFEVSVYLLGLLCLRHAWHRGLRFVSELLAGMAYGVVLEYATIQSFHSYTYGHFLVMVGGAVPLCIGVSWGIIIYTAMATSDHQIGSGRLRPWADALLALLIDLSMDAVAIRLGFWTWGTPGPWFGVPLGNFFGWFVVVASFSMLLRLSRQVIHRGSRRSWIGVLLPILAVPVSVLILLVCLNLYGRILSLGISAWLVLATFLVGSGIATLRGLWRSHPSSALDGVILAVPLFFHVFFVTALFWAGIYRQLPVLLSISTTLFVSDLAIHLRPIAGPMRQRYVQDRAES